MFFLMWQVSHFLRGPGIQHPRLPVTDAYTSLSAIIAFSRTLLGGHDSQGYIQEKDVCVDVNCGGMGTYSVFMNTHICVSLCSLTAPQADTVNPGTDGVSLVIPVMSIKLGWLTGRVWDGPGWGGGTQGHRRCQTRLQMMMMMSADIR